MRYLPGISLAVFFAGAALCELRKIRFPPPRVPVDYKTPEPESESEHDKTRRRLTTGDTTCETSVSGEPWEAARVGSTFVRGVSKTAVMEVVRRATAYLSRALQVRRMKRPLRVPRPCLATDEAGRCTETSEDGFYSCGSIADAELYIPAKFLHELVIYESGCGSDASCGVVQTYAEGNGGSDLDFLVLVTSEQDAICGTGGVGVLAFASPCLSDQCDRPFIGQINICPHSVDLETQQDKDRVATVVLHEIIHAMVFSSELFSRFRLTDGFTPRVARDLDGNPARIFFTCDEDANSGDLVVTDVASTDSGSYNAYVEDLSGVVEFFAERGNGGECTCPGVQHEELPASTSSSTWPGSAGGAALPSGAEMASCMGRPRGNCVPKLVTPAVRSAARTYFGCADLEGLEIENQSNDNSCSIIESHWEARILGTEIMTATISDDFGFLTPMTLALFEDSGWYKPVYSEATVPVQGAFFGYKKGCDFARDKTCISGQEGVDQLPTPLTEEFCNTPQEVGCSSDHMQNSFCDGYFMPPPEQTWFDYFEGFQGSLFRADYCPVYRAYAQGLCTSPANFNSAWLQFGEWYGESSRCLRNTLSNDGKALKDLSAGCMRVVCDDDNAKYTVVVNDGKTGTKAKNKCATEGQEITVSGFAGSIVCANPAIICANFDFGYLDRPTAGYPLHASDGVWTIAQVKAKSFAAGAYFSSAGAVLLVALLATLSLL